MPAAAKENDRVHNSDTHIVMVPSASGQTPTSLPGHIFDAPITEGLSSNVFIERHAAATAGSVARTNLTQHPPMSPGVAFQLPPSFEGRITMGSNTVFINGKPAARHGDPALTCNEPPLPPPGAGRVEVASSHVNIG
jgi:uncharacterized Zn-binding protein involved in type VI secretion